jgi:hypothetical protein
MKKKKVTEPPLGRPPHGDKVQPSATKDTEENFCPKILLSVLWDIH